MARWLEDVRRQRSMQSKGVAYLSAEYLLGRQLDNNLLATGLTDIAAEALVARAHEVCPYSNATRNNVDVRLSVV